MAPSRLIQRWSTDDVPASLKFDYWASALSQALIPMKVMSPDRRTFQAEQIAASLGPLTSVWSRGTAHESSRAQREIERSGAESFHLLVSRGGSWNLMHRGEHRLSRGDVVLTDSRYAHTIRVQGGYEIVNLKLPRRWIETWLADPEALVGRPIAVRDAPGAALSAFVSELVPDRLTDCPVPDSMIADQVGALLAIASGASDVPRGRRALLDRLEQCLRERCGEHDLTAQTVALSLRCEPSDLHRVLGAAGTTFAQALLEARTRRALAMLCACNAAGPQDLGVIALRAGFRDAGVLTRAIRRRTGCSPEKLRGGQAPASGSARGSQR